MFKRTERLGRDVFDTFFKQGRRFNGEHATIVYRPFPSLHVSVVVSKKVHKRAVVRNTLRRRVYAQLYASFKASPTTGVFIVLLKPSFALLSREDARAHVQVLVERIVKTSA